MAERSRHSIPELERAIARTRIDLMADVDELQRAVRARVDWRRPIRLHPLAVVGAALAIGFLLGTR